MRGSQSVVQPVQTEIGDRRHINQNFRHHDENNGEEQQFTRKANARIPRRPRLRIYCTF